MTADNDKSRLVDLLYDDELDEQTAGELRESIEESPDAQRELEANQAFLELLRTQTDEATVSDETHDSIMESARQAAEQRHGDADTSDDSTGPKERNPRTGRSDPSSSIWGRVDRSSLTQLAAAVIALAASGYLLYTMSTRQPADSQVASEAPAGPSGAADREPAAKESKSFAQREKAAESSEDRNEPKAPEGRAESDRGLSERAGGIGETSDEDLSEELDSDDEPSTGTEFARADNQKEKPTKKRAASGSKDKTQKRARQAQEPADSDDTAGLGALADNSRGRSGGEKAGPSEESDDDSIEAFGYEGSSSDSSDGSSDGKSAANEDASAELDDNKKLGKLMGGTKDEKAAAGEDAAGAAGSSADAPAEPQKNDDQKAEVAEGSSDSGSNAKASGADEKTESADQKDGMEALVKRVESAYQKRSWSDVASLSQKALSQATGRQAARLRELRARALAAQGQTDAAIRTWETLQSNHPDYKQSLVRDRLEALRSTDGEADSVPTSE